MLIPIHVKSHFSLGYGTLPIPELVELVVRAGVPAVALTDLENLYGQVQFQHACRAHAVRPLTGVELRAGFVTGRSHGAREGTVVVLVRDRTGYERLCRIVTRRRERPRAPTPDPLPALAGGGSGLFVLSDDLETLRRALDLGLDSSDLRFLLVRPHPSTRIPENGSGETEQLAAAGKLGVSAVADPDIVMGDSADHPLHALQVAIHLGKTVGRLGPGEIESSERGFGGPASWGQVFGDIPEAVAETHRVAEGCDFELGGRVVVPGVELPHGESADSRLERICRERLPERRGDEPDGPPYEARLDRELEIISEMGLAPYFLTVLQIVEEARRRGIETAGRGSAAGSLVCHLLGITRVDPLAQDLLFERFLHPGKRELPDIDLDVSSSRRDELLAWVFRRFGERVALASSLVAFQRRLAYREGLKALAVSPRLVERFCRLLPPEELPELPTPSAALALLPEETGRAAPLIERLVGQPRHLATHPGGIVIADGPIQELMPLERAAKGFLVSQYDGESLHRLGLIKIDLLGNRCLSELGDTLGLLEGREGAPLDLEDVPLDDPDTLALIDRAETLGCFQLESPAMRSVLTRLPIRDLDDVTAALATVRPGAAAGRAKESYLRRAAGREPPTDPFSATLFPDTHGIPLYEEDLMLALHRVAGFSLAEADDLRAEIQRADEEEMEALGARVVEAAKDRGRDRERVLGVWPSIAGFAAYSFSRAHAASYAHLAYLAAYMKAHHPVEFGCALLRHHGGMYPLRAIGAELLRRGIRIAPPSVNRSETSSTVERNGGGAAGKPFLLCGLGMIRGLLPRERRRILKDREERGPFRDLADLLRRVAPTEREVRALVLSGACDGLTPLQPRGYPFVHEEVLERLAAGVGPEELSGEGPWRAAGPPGPRMERYRALVRIRNELAYLGIFVTDHPMGVLRSEARRHGCLSSQELKRHIGDSVRFAGIVSAVRRVLATGGEPMRFLTFEDERGLVEAVLFPSEERRLGHRITTPGPYLVEGTIQGDDGDLHLVVSGLAPFHEREPKTTRVREVR